MDTTKPPTTTKPTDPKPPRPPISQITPSLYLGDTWGGNSIKIIEENSITAIVVLEPNKGPLWNRPHFRAHFPPSQRLFVACLDNSTQDVLIHLSGICDFIDRQLDAEVGGPPRESESEGYSALFPEEELKRLKKIEDESWTRGGTPHVLVHCEKGYSRSPMVLIAYLMRRRREGLDKVVQDVRGKRRMKPNPNFMEQLRVWESVEYEIWEDEGKTVPKAAYAEYLRGRKERLEEQGLTGDEPIGVQSL
ncbi:hypothetical protein V502_10601 [Pseudogymnoascus sp. VKM F-4520 (FW-2644)]|nr:hypothetical protein V502_10601 [Pseudogymnoascus sp. VKM F-4520 (FW-2644)]